MWALAAGVSVIIAIAAHALLCRLPLALNSVARFLLAGTALGIGLCLYCLAHWGWSAESGASIALYAAACELYIFLFTVTAGSISVSLLYRLRSGPLSESEIEAALGGGSMVDRRVRNMLLLGLLQQQPDGYAKTPRGAFVLWLYRRLRKFFWRAPLLPSIVTRTDPGPLSLAISDEAAHALRGHALNGLMGLFLLATVAAIFWEHLSGTRVFVGDSDRLNHYLTVLRFLTDGYREGALRTWDELIFGGFDIVPFTHPYPTSLLHLLWPSEKLFFAAGTISALLLVAAGWAAYAFIKDVCQDAFASLVGAGLYIMSALSILKVSQNDISFSAFVLIPIILLITRRIASGNSVRCFIGLVLALTYLLAFAFLQKAAYAVMLAASYAAYQAYRARQVRVIAVFAWASLVSVAASFPRIYSMGEEFLGSSRAGAAGLASNVRTATISRGYEALRWFDDRIFGSYAAEAAARNPFINMHEGFLLYLSTFAALLLVFALGRKLLAWKAKHGVRGSEAPFHVAVFIFCFLVITTKAGERLIYEAFLRIDFIHARVAIIALLPLCALVGLSLLALRSVEEPPRRRYPIVIAGLALAAVSVVIIELLAVGQAGKFIALRLPGASTTLFIASVAAVRVLLSAALFALVLLCWYAFRRRPDARSLVFYTLGFLMLGQAFAYARDQIAGSHMRTAGMPYAGHARLLAEPHAFSGPSKATAAALRGRLDTVNFRSVVICDPGKIAIYCSPHIAHFWGLRLMDGYLNAVPARVAALPFGNQALGVRALTFSTLERLPWPLLAMLNVKYAVNLNRPLFTNSVTTPAGDVRELRPDDLHIVENPIAPTPRAFFTRAVSPVRDMHESAQALFPGGKTPTARVPVEERSYVEGIAAAGTFPTAGTIRSRFTHHQVQIEMESSIEPRFLVLNERFHPRWKAYAGKTELAIYPTNVFMRGIVVPPGTTLVTLGYVPFIYSPPALACYAAAAVLLGFGFFAFRRKLGNSPAVRSAGPGYDAAPGAHYSHHRQAGE